MNSLCRESPHTCLNRGEETRFISVGTDKTKDSSGSSVNDKIKLESGNLTKP